MHADVLEGGEGRDGSSAGAQQAPGAALAATGGLGPTGAGANWRWGQLAAHLDDVPQHPRGAAQRRLQAPVSQGDPPVGALQLGCQPGKHSLQVAPHQVGARVCAAAGQERLPAPLPLRPRPQQQRRQQRPVRARAGEQAALPNIQLRLPNGVAQPGQQLGLLCQQAVQGSGIQAGKQRAGDASRRPAGGGQLEQRAQKLDCRPRRLQSPPGVAHSVRRPSRRKASSSRRAQAVVRGFQRRDAQRRQRTCGRRAGIHATPPCPIRRALPCLRDAASQQRAEVWVHCQQRRQRADCGWAAAQLKEGQQRHSLSGRRVSGGVGQRGTEGHKAALPLPAAAARALQQLQQVQHQPRRGIGCAGGGRGLGCSLASFAPSERPAQLPQALPDASLRVHERDLGLKAGGKREKLRVE